MKDTAFLQQLQQELPRRSLTPKATQRFEDTYKLLGVQKEAPAPKRRHKGLWVTATAACLCCGMLFGVNAAFPAFAESLPGVGQFFEAVNGAFASNSGKDLPVGTYLETYSKAEDVNVAATSGEYSLEVQQAFCDGHILTLSLDLTMPAQDAEPYSWVVVPYAGIQNENPNRAIVTINGTDYAPDSDSALFAQGNGHFAGSMAFQLKEPLENGQEVSVSISFPELDGRLAVNQGENGEIEFLPLATNLATSFTIPVNAEQNFAFACNAEDNGVTVTNVEVTPLHTTITALGIDMDNANNDPVLYTMDRQELTLTLHSPEMQNGVFTFDSAPQGTGKMVFRVYKTSWQEEVLAEFTIDLANKTVTPSTTYEDDYVLALDGPFHYDYIYGEIAENKTFENGFVVSLIDYTRWDNISRCVILTEGDYRAIHVDVYNLNGDIVASGDSQDTENSLATAQSDHFSPSDENSPYASFLILLDSEQGVYQPARGETLTIVVTDTATGEELTRQDITMTESFVQ